MSCRHDAATVGYGFNMSLGVWAAQKQKSITDDLDEKKKEIKSV